MLRMLHVNLLWVSDDGAITCDHVSRCRRDHYPDVFTSLEPYYNTYTANYLINMVSPFVVLTCYHILLVVYAISATFCG